MKTLLAACVASLSLCSPSIAHNDTVRRDFLPDGAGFSENPLVDGRVSFRYDQCNGETYMRLNVEGLLPNTTYGVRWESDGPILDNPMAFTTDSCGEARYVEFQIGDASGDPVAVIYIDNPDAGLVGEFDYDEIRAFSFLPLTRIRSFDAIGDGLTESPCADGKATIRYHQDLGETRFQLSMVELRPFTTYGIKFECENGPTLENAVAFTTNRRGNGKYQDFLIGLATRNVVITIFINDDPMGDPYTMDPGEERAIGYAE